MPPLQDTTRLDPLLPITAHGRLVWVAAGIAAFLAVSIVPVATFLVLIVVFGLAHVLTELRYVDKRFSARLGGNAVRLFLTGVGCIVLARLAIITGLAPHGVGIAAEVATGVLLAAIAATLAQRHRWEIASACLVFAGIAFASPWHALILIALLHNLTPMGFFAEALPEPDRTRALVILTVPFFLIPLLIATGLPLSALQSLTGIAPDWAPIAAGDVGRHFASFLPPELIDSPYAMAAFSGAVFAQSMHYLATILVLPRLGAIYAKGEGVVAWPKGSAFAGSVVAACAALAIYFMIDYTHARAVYGLMAAVHSWLEVPILVMAWGGALRVTAATH